MFDRTPPTSGLLHRFGPFVERMRRAIGDGIGRDHATLSPLAVMLFGYLGRTLRRLAALDARLSAGARAPARPRAANATAAHGGPSARPRRAEAARRPGGPVLARFHAGYLAEGLRELVEAPETAALLATAPEAGRLQRPLWRMLTPERLPEVLRLPRRPRRSGAEVGAEATSGHARERAPAARAAAPSWFEPAPGGPFSRVASHSVTARCRGQPAAG